MITVNMLIILCIINHPPRLDPTIRSSPAVKTTQTQPGDPQFPHPEKHTSTPPVTGKNRCFYVFKKLDQFSGTFSALTCHTAMVNLGLILIAHRFSTCIKIIKNSASMVGLWCTDVPRDPDVPPPGITFSDPPYSSLYCFYIPSLFYKNRAY